jgi:hypothetical protein
VYVKRATILLALVCCSHPSIGPDDAGVRDANLLDAIAPLEASVDGAASDFTSGARIKVVHIAGADGTQTIAPYMFDSQTNCVCQWVPVAAISSSWECAYIAPCDAGAAPPALGAPTFQ